MASQQLVWLVTGTSSGFGAEFVHGILARGDKVVAAARNADKIKHLEQAGAKVLRLDLTDSQDSVRGTIKQAVAFYERVDVLVNNAAFVSAAMAEDLEPEDIQKQFNTNVLGTMKVTQAMLPHFRTRKTGNIVFMSSLSGWIGHPGNAAYASSKFAIEGYAESLSAETAPLGIKTLLIEPGMFRTRLFASNNLQAKQSSIPEYADFSKGMLDYMSSQNGKQPGDPSKLVAIVLDLVRQEGKASGREVPLRLPLGSDCTAAIRAKCEEILQVLDKWQDVCESTDIAQ